MGRQLSGGDHRINLAVVDAVDPSAREHVGLRTRHPVVVYVPRRTLPEDLLNLLFFALILAGLSPFTLEEMEQSTQGAFRSTDTGLVVLRLEVRGTSVEHCEHTLTEEGIPSGADCEDGDPSSLDADFEITLDSKSRTYRVDGEGELIFKPGVYTESSSVGEASDAKLTPLVKRKPCPMRVRGGDLVYGAGSDRSVVVEKGWGNSDEGKPLELSPNCFALGEGWFVLRYKYPQTVVNGSSDGDATASKGWSFGVVDASQHDHVWQNTLGLRALKKKDHAAAKKHLEASVKSKPKYPHANYNLACTLSLMKKPFAGGKKHLEILLDDPALNAKYRKKIEKDPDLAHWRSDPAFAKWFKSR